MSDVRKATFGAGCFWGPEDRFMKMEGVLETTVGFMGGDVPNPSYKEVCTAKTGHAEVVHLEYDPEKISYDALLEEFFKMHDPTQVHPHTISAEAQSASRHSRDIRRNGVGVNRQGPDIGSQYRSVIFYHDDEQKKLAEEHKKELQKSGRYSPNTIATQIEPAGEFYKAEEYHQNYIQKGGKSVC